MINGQEMFALDDLARLFELTVREDTAGRRPHRSPSRGQTIVLSPGQGLASVGGRLVSLPAPPARDGRAWFVPVDFVARALAPALGTPIELRKPSRLIVSGDIRVPRVAGRIEAARRAGAGHVRRRAGDAAHGRRRTATGCSCGSKPTRSTRRCPRPPAPDLIQAVRPAERPVGHRHRSRPALRLVPHIRSARRSRRRTRSSSKCSPRRPMRRAGAAAARPHHRSAPPLLDLAPAGGTAHDRHRRGPRRRRGRRAQGPAGRSRRTSR